MQQGEVAAASESLQQQWRVAQAAAAERSQAVAEFERARGAARSVLTELNVTCKGLSAAWARLRGPPLPELEAPLESWVSGRSQAPLGEF